MSGGRSSRRDLNSRKSGGGWSEPGGQRAIKEIAGRKFYLHPIAFWTLDDAAASGIVGRASACGCMYRAGGRVGRAFSDGCWMNCE